jgi:signal transduction histidine kinase/HD-like signal output (HDOD) protein
MDTHNEINPGQDPRKIDAILSGIERLPTLPSVATRLMTIGSAEDINLDEVIGLIESDPAMSMTILRMCKTADKGLGDRITTVRRAVIMLGLEAVQVAALSVHIFKQLSRDEVDSPFDRSGFWVHSLAVACGAEAIARAHPKLGVSPEQAYLAGLLHDLGKVVLDMVLPKAYARVLEMSRNRRCALCLVERSMLGIDYHTAGKRLGEHWGLPSTIRDAMWLHGQPIESLPDDSNRELVSLITLAESWARDMHLGWWGDYGESLDLYDLAVKLGVEPNFFKDHAKQLIEGVSQRGEVLGLGDHAQEDLLIESLTGANRRLAQLNTELRIKAQSSTSMLYLLDAIDAFNTQLSADDTPERVFSAMVSSAAVLVGSERASVIFQTDSDGPWCTVTVDQGRLIQRTTRVQAPGSRDESVRPSWLSESGFVASLDLSNLTWLRDLFASVREAGTPMLIGSPTDAGSDQPSYLIVMPRTGSGGERIVTTPEFARVRDIWTRTLVQSLSMARSKRMGEELASANHAMAALRNELTSKESLVQLGKLAAGAAHEMNNPLSVILGRSQQLFERLGTQREREFARSIAEAAEQLSDLITALHLIADPPKPNLQPSDPVLLVREAIELARQRAVTQERRARIQFQAKGHYQPVNMDITLLAQAIAEPIINAVQANPGEVVTVSIESEPEFGRLSVRISDQGPGFSAETIKHAFDPFYSELPAGRRLGLGLTRARGLIELHRGEIELGNAYEGKGARVVVHLPTVDTAAQAA